MSDTPTIPSSYGLCLNYTDGMFLTATNMSLEQTYFSNWITLQNQLLYTAGVLAGLNLSIAANAMSVTSGAGIDSLGNFLVLPQPSSQSPGKQPTNPYGLYLAYPTNPVPTGTANVVSTAAFLQNGPATYDSKFGIMLALVELDPANLSVITSFTDKRVGVTSKLPIVIAPPSANVESVAPNLNGARHGVESVDTTTLLKPSDSKSTTVYYQSDKSPAFAGPPIVSATVQGGTPYAVNVSDIGTAHFTLTLTALQTRVDETLSAQVNWIALS